MKRNLAGREIISGTMMDRSQELQTLTHANFAGESATRISQGIICIHKTKYFLMNNIFHSP
jgi:hypothetical protein